MSIAANATHFFYIIRDNLIARSRTNERADSIVYANNFVKLTCVSLCSDGERIAVGDEKGRVIILKIENGAFIVHKEHYCLGGAVNVIMWSPDNKNIVALGNCKGMGASINSESGTKMGDITGFTDVVLCGAYTPEKFVYSAG